MDCLCGLGKGDGSERGWEGAVGVMCGGGLVLGKAGKERKKG